MIIRKELILPDDGSYGKIEITGLEANFLLFLLDDCLEHSEPEYIEERYGIKIEHLEALRERLFAAHEHPPEPEED